MRLVPQAVHFLDEIDARQDDVLRQLDELDARVLRVLQEFAPRTLPTTAKSPSVEAPRTSGN
jgi:hypothetical protein